MSYKVQENKTTTLQEINLKPVVYWLIHADRATWGYKRRKKQQSWFTCVCGSQLPKSHLLLHLHKAKIGLVSLLRLSHSGHLAHQKTRGSLTSKNPDDKRAFSPRSNPKDSVEYWFIIGLLFQDQTCPNAARYQSELGISLSKSENQADEASQMPGLT